MGILTNEERNLIQSSCDGKVLACSVARLYQALNHTEYTHAGTGGLALHMPKSGGFTFSLIDMKVISIKKTGKASWEFPINNDIKYSVERPHFHSFVGQSCMIGLSFADESDANEFYQTYLKREDFANKKGVSDSNTPEQTKNNGGGGIFGFGRKLSSSEKKGKIDKSMISNPTDFQHVSHVGFSASAGYNVQNIPPEWKIIFEKAGITEEQLQDRKQMKKVKRFMKENANLVPQSAAIPAPDASPRNSRRAPPPPPSRPSSSARAPPPAPPSRLPLGNTLQPESRPSPPAVPSRGPPPAIPERQPPTIPQRAPPVIPSRPLVPERSHIPERTPPSIPDRAAPAVPVRHSPSSSAGTVPPPPPPPPSIPAVPVQSPPAPQRPAHSQQQPIAAPRQAAPIDLLSQIRSGTQLKKVEVDSEPHAPVDNGDDLANALRNALADKFKGAYSDSDSDDDDNEW